MSKHNEFRDSTLIHLTQQLGNDDHSFGNKATSNNHESHSTLECDRTSLDQTHVTEGHINSQNSVLTNEDRSILTKKNSSTLTDKDNGRLTDSNCIENLGSIPPIQLRDGMISNVEKASKSVTEESRGENVAATNAHNVDTNQSEVDCTPNIANSPVNIMKMAQLRNERRYEQRRRRIQARFTSDLPEMFNELEVAKKREGAFRSHEFASFGCVGFAETQGRRPTMEDTHSIICDFQIPELMMDGDRPSCVLLSLFDGHGGIDAAKYAQEHLPELLSTKVNQYYKLKSRLLALNHSKQTFRNEYIRALSETMRIENSTCTYLSNPSQIHSCGSNSETSDSCSSKIDDSSKMNMIREKLESILSETIELKYEFSLLVKRLSVHLKAPEIEHVHSDDDDSSSEWQSDVEEVGSSEEKMHHRTLGSCPEEHSIEPIQLENLTEIDAIQILIRETFLEINDCIQENDIQNGCTASVILIAPRYTFVGNVGDSRIVLCRNGKAIRLTKDHRPDDSSEKERIRYLGGYISGSRVNGVIAVTRALGDSFLSPFISGDPSTQFMELNPIIKQNGSDIFNTEQDVSDHTKDEFIIVACDGLWDFVSDERAIQEVRYDHDPRIAAIKLRNLAYQSGSTDNISVCVFRFTDMNGYTPVSDEKCERQNLKRQRYTHEITDSVIENFS